MEFAERFGRAEIYQVATDEPSHERRDRVPAYRRGRTLFRKDATLDALAERWDAGAQIKKTPLTDDFTFDHFRDLYGDSAIVLFIVDESTRARKLLIQTTEGPKAYRPKQKLIALINAPTMTQTT
jgi:hypothetical protein